ncbi:hypothetical protein RFI_35889, partial [Reticulomyxa filosa]
VHAQPQEIYRTLCDPFFRFRYDKIIETIEVLEKLDDNTYIARFVHTFNQCYMKVSRESILVIKYKEIIPNERYVRRKGKKKGQIRYELNNFKRAEKNKNNKLLNFFCSVLVEIKLFSLRCINKKIPTIINERTIKKKTLKPPGVYNEPPHHQKQHKKFC